MWFKYVTINHDPDPYCLPLARSTNYEPDRLFIRLVRSTYYDYHTWCVFIMFDPISLPRVSHGIVGEEVNFQFQFLILIVNFSFNFQFRLSTLLFNSYFIYVLFFIYFRLSAIYYELSASTIGRTIKQWCQIPPPKKTGRFAHRFLVCHSA